MNWSVARTWLAEMLGAFAIVYFGAGVVCVNHMTLPDGQGAADAARLAQHPGLVGIALAQGCILAAVLAATARISGGFANPAITISLWVFNRLEGLRAVWLIGAQLFGALFAGLCLRMTFHSSLLREIHMGTPHLNPLAYPVLDKGHQIGAGEWWSTLAAGGAVEFVLTFFLVFAIFFTVRRKWDCEDGVVKAGKSGPESAPSAMDMRLAPFIAGLAMTACVLFGFPLTGAATNPARWYGTVFFDWQLGTDPEQIGPFADVLVYTAGPILGALLAGVVCFLMAAPENKNRPQGKSGEKKVRK